jgi:hypothetical protein
LAGRNLGKNALLEFEPQAWHRQKQRGACALQVGQKGVQRFGKKDVNIAIYQRGRLDPGALDNCAPVAGTTACGCAALPVRTRVSWAMPSAARVMALKLIIAPLGVPVEPEV